MIIGDATDPRPYSLIREPVDAVITSPPYAMQRASAYGGAEECRYPAWTVAWMSNVARVLKPNGSVLMVIRSHVRDGAVDPYLLRTRLALHDAGWREPEELVWHKVNGPPLGNINRPRRSWEHILWFARPNQYGKTDPWCDTRANGQKSVNIGYKAKGAQTDFTYGGREGHEGFARGTDVAQVLLGQNEKNVDHPAVYPPALAEWMIRLVCPPRGLVLDPFMGSGTTAVAAEKLGIRWVGIDLQGTYAQMTVARASDKRTRDTRKAAAADAPATTRPRTASKRGAA